MSYVDTTWRALTFLGTRWKVSSWLGPYSLVIGEVEKELLGDHPSEATAENVTEEATDVTKVMEEAAITPL